MEIENQHNSTMNKLFAFFVHIYSVYKFIVLFFREVFMPPYEFKEIIRQCYEVGCKSLLLISTTGFITGIVFTKQSRPPLVNIGATSWLPSLISIALIRALAPLISALIISGKVGSNMGAELGSMKVTEQIDAMEVSATNPFKFLVTTRVLAITTMTPILALYMGFVGLFGAYLNIYVNENISYTAFIEHGFQNISFLDIFSSIIKSIVFGFTVGITGCYQGYFAEKGTQGVGKAANAAVVISMFLVFLEEVIIVQIVNSIR